MFTNNGTLTREMETRVKNANTVSYQLPPLLKHPNISIKAKNKSYKAYLCQHCDISVKHGHGVTYYAKKLQHGQYGV